jgi:hypothetical protein
MSRKEISADDWVALGKRSIEAENKFGANLTIANAATEDLWGSATAFVRQSSAAALQVYGGANDVMTTGTGAWKVMIYGIDANFDRVSVEVELAGATPVTTVTAFLAVYRMVVTEAGSGGKNAGLIVCELPAGTVPQCFIEIGYNQSTHGHFQVPAGFTAIIDQVAVSTDAASGVNAKLYTQETTGTDLKTVKKNFQASGIPQKVKIVIPEKTWVYWEATNGSGGTAFVSVEYDMRLIPTSMIRSY